MDEEVQVSDVTAFKKKAGFFGTPVELPSGLTVKLRAVGMRAFLDGGMVPNSLMSIISEQLDQNSGKPPADSQETMQGLMKDPEKISDLLELIDKVTIASFVQPSVHNAPAVGEPRAEDKLYVDEIDDEDKMFVFSFTVGGTRDVEQFRSEFAASVESVSSGLNMESAAQ